MKKNIGYLVIIFLMIFCGMNRVEAASEMACSYYSDSNDLSKPYVYIYQKSNVKPIAYSFKKDGSALVIKNNITIENLILENDGYMKKCTKAKYAKITDSKIVLKSNETTDNKVSGDKKTWNCSYNYKKGNLSYELTVDQNKYGVITYSLKKNGSAINDVRLRMFSYSFGGSTCPEYAYYGSIESNTKEIAFYKDKNNLKDGGLSETSEYVTKATVNASSVPQDETKECQKDGTNCNNYDELKGIASKNVSVYENIGLCSSIKNIYTGNKGYTFEADTEECSGLGDTTGGKNFINSSYMILTVDSSTGKVPRVYFPITNASEDEIFNRLKEYANGDANIAYVADLFVGYDEDEIPTIQDWNTEKKCKNDRGEYVICHLSAAPKWYALIDGLNANEFDESFYIWKRYDVSLEDMENNYSEDPDELIGNASGYCKYNNGLLMSSRFNSNIITLSVFNTNTSVSGFRSASYKYVLGSDTNEGISWFGYENIESGNNVEFQNELADCICPEKIVYNNLEQTLKICHKKSDCDDTEENGVFVGTGVNCTVTAPSGSFDKKNYTSCEELISEELREVLNDIMNFLRVIVPIILLVLGIVDFGKATFGIKEDDMKKAQQTFIKRIIIAAVIFIIPTFVNILLDIANIVWGWNADTCSVEFSTIINWW